MQKLYKNVNILLLWLLKISQTESERSIMKLSYYDMRQIICFNVQRFYTLLSAIQQRKMSNKAMLILMKSEFIYLKEDLVNVSKSRFAVARSGSVPSPVIVFRDLFRQWALLLVDNIKSVLPFLVNVIHCTNLHCYLFRIGGYRRSYQTGNK